MEGWGLERDHEGAGWVAPSGTRAHGQGWRGRGGRAVPGSPEGLERVCGTGCPDAGLSLGYSRLACPHRQAARATSHLVARTSLGFAAVVGALLGTPGAQTATWEQAESAEQARGGAQLRRQEGGV